MVQSTSSCQRACAIRRRAHDGDGLLSGGIYIDIEPLLHFAVTKGARRGPLRRRVR